MLEFLQRCCHGLLAFAMLALAGTAGAVTIESIEFASLPGDKTEIRLIFDGVPPEPTGYTIEQPARIVLDMPGVVSALDEKHHNLGIGNARRVSIISTKDRTRAIVNLTQLVSYETEIRGNTLYLVVGADSTAGLPAQPEFAAADDRSPTQRTVTDSQVLDIDFRRGEEGEGRIIVKLSNPKAPVNVTSDGGRIKVEIRNTVLPKNLQRRLDVTDFATPVQLVDTIQEGSSVTLTVTTIGDYDYLAYQADDTLTINVNPLTEEEVERREDIFKYTGEKLSLNFQDIEVRSVLQLIADFTDLNLVASDTVSGRITLRLKNVPWDQALDLILKTKGLDKRQVGNVLLVAPAAEIAAREKLELENQKQISELAPLRTEFIQISYASAMELFELFSNASSESGDQSMLSPRGSVIVDERTNSIILTDTADRLNEFRRVIAQLDVPVRQVLIEARIVTANANFSEQLGIRWGGGALKHVGIPAVWKFGGSRDTLSELQNIITDPLGEGSITSPGDLVVDLGVSGAGASSFGIGFTGEGYLLDLELSALTSEGHAEVVARPKVITADKSTAMIESGVEIPYQEATSSGATSTSFKDAVLSLEVTPQITPDNRIIMELNVKQDTVGQVFNGIPSINTNEIQTQVLVDNGQTIVLGGVFQTDRNISTTKTPFLGDLPYIGRFFRRTIERDDKQELLIFITPRIIQDSLTN
ncbi:MAG: type IV pilus secretin PilQ [Gammaproteobacteria bacterium]|nr:MAG: type IV pilus secretin PilQ [Gammaproteobacteria bacterium]TDJ40674.1 MAG: type IV pilus secretin PilQ [Gammaproteobacteria bacterium]